MDPFGDHALSCASLGSYTRHNDLKKRFADVCQDIGLEVETEVGPLDSSRRPADVKVYGLDPSEPVAVDFAFAHVLQPSCNLAAVRAGKLAAEVERRKNRENTAICRQAGFKARAFVVETLGAWGGGARFLVQRLVRLWAQKFGVSVREAGLHVHGVLGSTVVKAVCRQLERGFPAPGCAAGMGERDGVGGLNWAF